MELGPRARGERTVSRRFDRASKAIAYECRVIGDDNRLDRHACWCGQGTHRSSEYRPGSVVSLGYNSRFLLFERGRTAAWSPYGDLP